MLAGILSLGLCPKNCLILLTMPQRIFKCTLMIERFSLKELYSCVSDHIIWILLKKLVKKWRHLMKFFYALLNLWMLIIFILLNEQQVEELVLIGIDSDFYLVLAVTFL